MLNRQIAAFGAEVQENPTLQAEIRGLGRDLDGITAMGRREGFHFSSEELGVFLQSFGSDDERELADDELDNLSGSGMILLSLWQQI
ncbi:MAG: Nif11-like leader peptide family natural product precursor [Chloroflexota bacterium]